MTRLAVTKCQGAGNDFVLIDHSDGRSADYAAIAQQVCDRHFSIGADGLLVLLPATVPGADISMRIFNADGSEAEMCGNGIRCVARYLRDRRSEERERLAIETRSGTIRTEIVAEAPAFQMRVAMGVPDVVKVFDRERVAGISAAFADVTIGNPHCVAFVTLDLMPIDLEAFARAIEAHGTYDDGVNVEVARIFEGGHIALRVYERGVGETLACGTGACAVAIAAITMDRAKSPVRLTMQGGEVQVDWAGPGEQVYLTGGAELVFDTTIDVEDATADRETAAPAAS